MEKENLELTKEKMIKSCRVTRKVINGFIFGMVGALILAATIVGISAVVSIYKLPEGQTLADAPEYDMVEKVVNKVDEIKVKINEIAQKKNDSATLSLVTVIAGLKILDLLLKILKNTEEEKTPFTMENIKCFKRIVILAFVTWICTTGFIINVGLIYIVVLWTLYNIFKYAYKLQTESDETL